MLTEDVELSLNHVGLGTLDEYSLMAIFATAQAHRLTQGTGLKLTEVTDNDGSPLYPGYYFTHLTVPLERPLARYRVWDRLSVGVEVKTFGRMLLESTYAAADLGELPPDATQWTPERLPMMRGSSLFVVDGQARPSTPKAGALADLPKLTKSPPNLERFRNMRAAAAWPDGAPATLRAGEPLRFPVAPVRDAAAGHGLMFAKFVELMNLAERELCAQRVWPSFPTSVLDCFSILEREVFFFGNARANDTLLVDIGGWMEPVEKGPAPSGTVVAGQVRFEMQLYRQADRELMACSRVRKAIIVPKNQAETLKDAERLGRTYQSKTSQPLR